MVPAERATQGPPPIPPPGADGMPWVRLITGLVALAIFAMPAGRHGAEWTARPIPDRVISVAALPPLSSQPPAQLPSSDPDEVAPESAPPAARPEQSPARAQPALLFAQPKELRAKAASHRWPRAALSRSASGGYTRTASARHRLTRAEVVRDYIRSREQVAALTREDSGSAYLMRVAARHRESRPVTEAARRQLRPNRSAVGRLRTADEPRRRPLRA